MNRFRLQCAYLSSYLAHMPLFELLIACTPLMRLQVLLQYIELFVALLKTHPRTNEHHMHHKFYATCTEQLLEPEVCNASMVQCKVLGHLAGTLHL